MSTVVETKGPTDMFATLWAVKMLNFLGLSDVVLQCDLESSLIKWAESVTSNRTERRVIRSSPDDHQSSGGVENYQKQLQGQVRTLQAVVQEHTKYVNTIHPEPEIHKHIYMTKGYGTLCTTTSTFSKTLSAM